MMGAGGEEARRQCEWGIAARSELGAPSPPAALAARREVKAGAGGLPGFQAGLPLFIGGISLGGCIAFHAALADQDAGSQLFRCSAARSVDGAAPCRPCSQGAA